MRVKPLDILARRAWRAGERLDLYADIERTVDAIGTFAGASEARRHREFSHRTQQVYTMLANSYIRSASPSPFSLVRSAGISGLPSLMKIQPFTTLWKALGEYFHDERLRQLFGRYATYCGSSPFLAPATLMLIAHVEQDGVCAIDGGMHKLAQALADLAVKRGAVLRYGADVAEVLVTHGRATGVRLTSGESIDADAVVLNADIKALAAGLFGNAVTGAAPISPRGTPSLSADLEFSRGDFRVSLTTAQRIFRQRLCSGIRRYFRTQTITGESHRLFLRPGSRR